MTAPITGFRDSVTRHGFWPTLLRAIYRQLRGTIEFELCRVESASGQPYDWTDLQGSVTRAVSCDEFHDNLCDELQDTDLRWAFERGDLCVATILEGKVVGYNFTTRHPTRVHEGLLFYFPDRYSYSFASLTAPSHRGRRLERERWKVARRVMQERTGSLLLSIWYINVANLESLAANKHSGVQQVLHGYAGFARLFGRWFTFASPGCRAVGAGFEARDTSPRGPAAPR